MILIPLAIVALVGTASAVQAKRNKVAADPSVVAQRMELYKTAINEVKDPAKLRALAELFAQYGMTAEAEMLCKRACLQELPKEQKDARKEAFKKAMASTNVPAILEMASIYDSQGCTWASEKLREYAAGLNKAEEKTHDEA